MAVHHGIHYDPSAVYDVAERDVAYLRHGGETRYARVYAPAGDGPFPVLLSVHGGAWSGGDHTNNPLTSAPLAASGIVVAAIGLRVAPEFPYPAQVQDAHLAIRWLRAHAAEFNGDPGALGGIGYSSGGHTLPLAAMRPGDARYGALPLDGAPDAAAALDWMVLCWPVIDSHARYMVAQEKGAERLVVNSLGYFLSEEAMHEGNPQELVERGEQGAMPPTLIAHGTADENVPVAHAERFAASYAAAGGAVQLTRFEGQPHGFANEPGPQTDRLVALVKAFTAERVDALRALAAAGG